MKKIKLNLDNIQGAEVLSREQLKKVVGGFFGTGPCGTKPYCDDDSDCCSPSKCIDGNCRAFIDVPCGNNPPCDPGQHCVSVFYPPTDPTDPTDNGYYDLACG